MAGSGHQQRGWEAVLRRIYLGIIGKHLIEQDVAGGGAGINANRAENPANNETVDPAGMPACIERGAYISMSGTNPRALVQISRANGYVSDGAIRQLGLARNWD